MVRQKTLRFRRLYESAAGEAILEPETGTETGTGTILFGTTFALRLVLGREASGDARQAVFDAAKMAEGCIERANQASDAT
jgi:hypothetical protein